MFISTDGKNIDHLNHFHGDDGMRQEDADGMTNSVGPDQFRAG